MSRLAAAALVFTTSAAVLILEILAGRLLAPYVGVTLETFTGIIGTILAGIALGSWAGGRLADRFEPGRLLGPEVIAGGATTLLAIPLVDALGSGMRGARPEVIVLLALVGFFAPATLLSMVSPTVVKLQLDDLGRTGRVVGRLSAVGTAGAIFGTFVTGFVLVAALPTRPIIRVVGGGLLLLGLGLLWRFGSRRVTAGATLAVVAAGALSFASSSPCEHESAYFCARIETDPARPTGRTLWLDTLRHSYVDLADPTHLEFSYAQVMSDVLSTVAPEGEPLDVVHVGGGGFSLPRYLRATRPGTESTVLELDPLLVELNRDELGLELRDDIEVLTGDARLTLQRLPEMSADVVVGDAFGGVSVPWHLTTVEFVEQIRRRLRPGGTYALNLIDYPPLGFARAEAATLAAVFEHVALLAPASRVAGTSGGNFVMVASDEPIDLDAILARNRLRGDDEVAITGAELEAFISDAEALTDDRAPVDQLLTPLPPPPPSAGARSGD